MVVMGGVTENAKIMKMNCCKVIVIKLFFVLGE